jgi:hypothetical protein
VKINTINEERRKTIPAISQVDSSYEEVDMETSKAIEEMSIELYHLQKRAEALENEWRDVDKCILELMDNLMRVGRQLGIEN